MIQSPNSSYQNKDPNNSHGFTDRPQLQNLQNPSTARIPE